MTHGKSRVILGMSKIQTGDIISITLDLFDKYVLIYNSRTGKSKRLDIEEKDEDLEYRLAVGISLANVAVSIDKFEQKFEKV